jgi:hypothetical protein
MKKLFPIKTGALSSVLYPLVLTSFYEPKPDGNKGVNGKNGCGQNQFRDMINNKGSPG